MNEELILKKRAEGMRLMIESNLDELVSLAEVIATEVIRVKPGPDCYWFICRLLQAMIKTEDSIRECAVLENQQQDADEHNGQESHDRSKKFSIKPHILDYYMKESLDNYFRGGLKKPLPKIPGCDGCLDAAHENEEVEKQQTTTSVGRRCNTIGDISEHLPAPVDHNIWEDRQSWHALQFPESLSEPNPSENSELVEEENDKALQVDVDELTYVHANDDDLPLAQLDLSEEVTNDPGSPPAPPTSPRPDSQEDH